MRRCGHRVAWVLAITLLLASSLRADPPSSVDLLLNQENADRQVTAVPLIDDMAFLRRVTIDLIGRIPTETEIQEYMAWPSTERRAKLVDRLLKDDRFTDRWTVFFADLLRIRSQSPGGDALTAFVHKAIAEGMPYDVMVRQLISANGKAGRTPEVGFILGDDANPLAMAGVTAQVFMGVRISCAECHDHPFDVWTREQFYGLAAYFGKTRRMESNLTRTVYTVESDDTTILWPPEDEAKDGKRTAMKPTFPFEVAAKNGPAAIRLARLRADMEQKKAAQLAKAETQIDDLLEASLDVDEPSAGNADIPDVASEAASDAQKLNVHAELNRESELRRELAQLVTSPRNHYFSQTFVNRVWAELLGRGIVDPVDDFNSENPASHPKTLEFLANEFVASGYDIRTPIRMIVLSEAYQRGHASGSEQEITAAEAAFAAAPVRRMLGESLFDSVVLAGHLFEQKHPAGENLKTITTIIREPVKPKGGLAGIKGGQPAGMSKEAMMQQAKAQLAQSSGYDLESSIELNFDELLMAEEEAPDVEMMSAEEIEAKNMMAERVRYIEREIKTTIDDNPVFTSAMRMASPAPPAHFLRIFGQTSRDAFDARDHSASMRQALMMLNGKLTNEASRVGKLEPMHDLLVGRKAEPKKAIALAYREILTREPSQDEVAEGEQILASASDPLEGMADLRWVLFNSHEFRFLP